MLQRFLFFVGLIFLITWLNTDAVPSPQPSPASGRGSNSFSRTLHFFLPLPLAGEGEGKSSFYPQKRESNHPATKQPIPAWSIAEMVSRLRGNDSATTHTNLSFPRKREPIHPSTQQLLFAHRIISLAPNLTEILYDIGAGQQLVGRDKYSDYPAAARGIPIVGDYFKLNLEQILKLNPDLILLEGGPYQTSQLQYLQTRGVKIYHNRANSLGSISKTMIDLGRLTGHEVVANVKSREFLADLARHRKQSANVTVFYELWHAPLMTVNNQTIIGEMIALCGGNNIAAAYRQATPYLSAETVLKADPDIIITSVNTSSWEQFKNLKAVKAKQLFFVAPTLVERTGPRVLQGLNEVCRLIALQKGPKP